MLKCLVTTTILLILLAVSPAGMAAPLRQTAHDVPANPELRIILYVSQSANSQTYDPNNVRFTAVQNAIRYLTDLYQNFLQPIFRDRFTLHLAVVYFSSEARVIGSNFSDGSTTWFNLDSVPPGNRQRDLDAWLDRLTPQACGVTIQFSCGQKEGDYVNAEALAYSTLLNALDPNLSRQVIHLYITDGLPCSVTDTCNQATSSTTPTPQSRTARHVYDMLQLRTGYELRYGLNNGERGSFFTYMLGFGGVYTTYDEFWRRLVGEETEDDDTNLGSHVEDCIPNHDAPERECYLTSINDQLYPALIGIFVKLLSDPSLNEGQFQVRPVSDTGLLSRTNTVEWLHIPLMQQNLVVVTAFDNQDRAGLQISEPGGGPIWTADNASSSMPLLRTDMLDKWDFPDPFPADWLIQRLRRTQNPWANDSVFIYQQPVDWQVFVTPLATFDPRAELKSADWAFQYEDVRIISKFSPHYDVRSHSQENPVFTVLASACPVVGTAISAPDCQQTQLNLVSKNQDGEYYVGDLYLHEPVKYSFQVSVRSARPDVLNLDASSPQSHQDLDVDVEGVVFDQGGLQCSANEGIARLGQPWTVQTVMRAANPQGRASSRDLPDMSAQWQLSFINRARGDVILSSPRLIPQQYTPSRVPGQDHIMVRTYQYSGVFSYPDYTFFEFDLSPLLGDNSSMSGSPASPFRCSLRVDDVVLMPDQQQYQFVDGQPQVVTIAVRDANDAAWLAGEKNADLSVQVVVSPEETFSIPMLPLTPWGNTGAYIIDLGNRLAPASVYTLKFRLVWTPSIASSPVQLYPLPGTDEWATVLVTVR